MHFTKTFLINRGGDGGDRPDRYVLVFSSSKGKM